MGLGEGGTTTSSSGSMIADSMSGIALSPEAVTTIVSAVALAAKWAR